MPVPGEFRRALRSLDRRRTFAATVVLTLTLAFSIPAVVLSTVDRHFWRPLDLVDSDRLFTLQIQVEDGRFSPLSHPEYVQLRDVGVDGFSLAAFGQFDFTLAAGGAPTQGLVGRTVRLGPQALTVVGVAVNPLPGPAHEPDFWVPLSASHLLLPESAGILLGPAARWLNTVGRLFPSTSRNDAGVLAALARDRLPADTAAARTGDWRFVARPVNHARLGPEYHRETTQFLTILVAITGVFLFAACSNMVLLLLTRLTAVRPPALGVSEARVTGRGRRQRGLVTAQVAVAGVLVIAAGLLLRSAQGVASLSPGFVPRGVLVAQLHTAGYSAADGHVFYRRLLDELRRGGLVTSAALGWHTPLSVFHLSVAVEIPGTSMDVSGNVVSTDYFRTLGVAVLEGREFTGEDHADSPPVAIVNRTLAERLWPGRSAVGRVLTFPRSGGDRTVVGVVDVVRYNTLAEPARPLAYLPLAQRFFPRAFIHARSPADAGVTLQHVRRVLADLDPAVPLSGESTLGDRVEEALDRWRAPAMLAGILAVVTLVLTMGGLYGVLMLAVGQRTRELAIRVALGAREASVRWIVLFQGLRLVAAGALVGLAAAVPLMGLLASQLYGIAPHDVTTLGASLVVLLVAGVVACDLPARRAARLDTAAALRSE